MHVTKNAILKGVHWIAVLAIVGGVALAQFSSPTDYIHRRFPQGHIGYPGLTQTVDRWGWPQVFLTRTSPSIDTRWVVQYRGIVIDAVAGAVLVLSVLYSMRRIGSVFSLASLLRLVGAIGVCLATIPLIGVQPNWYAAIPVYFGIVCMFSVALGSICQISRIPIARPCSVPSHTNDKTERASEVR